MILLDANNDSFSDSFELHFNISADQAYTLEWQFTVLRYDGIYQYIFDEKNGTIVSTNTTEFSSTGILSYAFNWTGDYDLEVYWFDLDQNSLIYYEEYSLGTIIGLEANSHEEVATKYNYWYHWQPVDLDGDHVEETVNFSITFYFASQYDVTFDYELVSHKIDESATLNDTLNTSGTVTWSGPGDSLKTLVVYQTYVEFAFYEVEFRWTDFLIYNWGEVYRSVSFETGYFDVVSNDGTHDNAVETVYVYEYNHDDYGHQHGQYGFFSFFGFILQMILGGIVFLAVAKFLRTKKLQKTFLNQNTYRRPSNSAVSAPINTRGLFCEICGSRSSIGDNFCNQCGKTLD